MDEATPLSAPLPRDMDEMTPLDRVGSVFFVLLVWATPAHPWLAENYPSIPWTPLQLVLCPLAVFGPTVVCYYFNLYPPKPCHDLSLNRPGRLVTGPILANTPRYWGLVVAFVLTVVGACLKDVYGSQQ